jgi:hypothetical protein
MTQLTVKEEESFVRLFMKSDNKKDLRIILSA